MDLGNINVAIGADIASFEAGMAQVQTDLGKVAAAANAAAGRYTDAQGRMREANGRFVSAATLAAEAAGRLGGSLGNLSDAATKAGTSINSGLVASFAAFDRAVKPLEAGVGRLGEGMKSLGSSLTVGVTAPLTLLGGASLKSAGDIQALERGFAATYKGSEDLSTALAKVQQLAKLPGLGLKEAEQGATNLQAAGFSADLATRALSAFGNALATVGKGKADLDGVGLALSQIASKGKVSAEEINQLAERVPQIRQAMVAAFGSADTEVLQRANITANAFVEGVTKELAKLPQVTGGINNSFENLGDAGTIALSKIGDAINKNFNVEGILGKVSDALIGLADGFAALSPSTQRFVLGTAAAAAAIGPLLYGMGAVLTALPALEAGLAVLGTTATAALGPIGIGAAAVAAAAYLIIDNWDDLVAYFTSGEGGRVFGDLAESITNSVSVISGAFGELNGQGNFGDLISASGVLKALFRDIAVGIASISNVAGGSIGAVSALFSGNLTEAANQAERALYGLIDPIANLLGFSKKEPTDSVLYILTQQAKEFNAVGPQLAANLALLNSVRLDTLADQAKEAAKQVGLLESLRAKLKDLKEKREKETTVSAITVDNAAIKALEEQIKKLEGVDSTSKKAADAVAKLRQDLARLTALDGLLGDTPSQVEVLDRRANALAAGLKTLVDAGVSPSSRAFQGFVADLVNTSQALDKLRGAGGSLDLKPANIKSLIPATIGDTLPQDVARLLGDYAQKPIPFKPRLDIKPITEGILNFDDKITTGLFGPKGAGFSDELKAGILDIGKGFREAEASAAAFGNRFDEGQAKADVLRKSLEKLVAEGLSSSSDEFKQLAADLQNTATLADINTAATDALASGLTNLAGGLLEGLGQLAAGNLTLEAFGATILGLVGKLATQLGQAILAIGIGLLKLKTAFTDPVSAIAAGAALIVVGAAISSIASSAVNSGGGSVSSPSASYSSGGSFGGSQAALPKEIVLRLRGEDAAAVLRLNEYRNKRSN